jgi:alkylation response protein AidB-like acyl-CoA dehydrogenase
MAVARGAIRVGAPEWTSLLRRIADGAEQRERDLVAPHEQIGWLREAGFGAVRLPVDAGGSGVSIRELFELLIDLAEADSNVAHILRVHFSFVEQQLVNPDPWSRAVWFDRIARGAIIGNGISERDGRPLGFGFSTSLTPDGDGFRLTGVKYYSTGSLYAQWTQIFASTPEGHNVAVVIPVDRAGVTLSDDWDGFGQRLTATGTTILDDVAVFADEVVDLGPATQEPPAGYHSAFLQLYLQAVTAGILRSVRNDAAALAGSRVRSFTHSVDGQPASDPQVLQVVGEISAAAFAAQAIVVAAAERIATAASSVVDGRPDADLAVDAQLGAAAAKVSIDGFAHHAATRLFDAGAAGATSSARNLDRHWRNIRTISTHNPAFSKATALGDHEVNGTPPPRNGYF